MRARRALLYMPGDDMRKIRKATTLDADCICMDMEDGVALSRKSEARRTIQSALSDLDFGRSERLVRINPVGSGLEEADLDAALSARPDGIVLPKVHDATQVQWAADRIRSAGLTLEEICLILVVESARGIVNLAQIAGSSAYLQAIIFGAEDLAGDVGAQRTPQGWEVFYARSAIVTFASAYGLQANDMVTIDFHDEAALRREALQGAQLGFAGKQVIHPNQVGTVQEAFTPTEQEIAQAQRVVQAFRENQGAGIGAFALDGKMIDAPIIKSAERVLERARAARKI